MSCAGLKPITLQRDGCCEATALTAMPTVTVSIILIFVEPSFVKMIHPQTAQNDGIGIGNMQLFLPKTTEISSWNSVYDYVKST